MTATDPRVVAAYEESLRGIALATVRCRRQVSGFHVPPQAAQELLVECERWLSALIALNAVPGPPPTDRRTLPGRQS